MVGSSGSPSISVVVSGVAVATAIGISADIAVAVDAAGEPKREKNIFPCQALLLTGFLFHISADSSLWRQASFDVTTMPPPYFS